MLTKLRTPIKRYISYALGVFFVVTFLLLALDSYKSADTVAKYLIIESKFILLGYLAISLTLLFCWKIRLPKILRHINSILILSFSSIICIQFTLIDYFTPPNFIFDRLLLNYEQLGIIALGSLFVAVINADLKWLIKKRQLLFFASAPVLLIALGVVRLWPYDVFMQIVKEDALIENIQFATLLLSSLLSFYISFKTFRFIRFLSIVYLLAGFGLFFVAGDEISWGQRLLNISTPEALYKNNVQDEINIHNLYFFNDLVGYAYILVGVYGAFFWLISNKISKYFSIFNWITPQPYLFIYFFAGAFYNFCVLFLGIYGFGEWSEVAELMLHLGVLLFIIQVVFKIVGLLSHKVDRSNL